MGFARAGLFAALALFSPLLASACTVFAVGKKATKDGSVIISHSDDGDPKNDARLIYVPAKDHVPGSLRPVFYSGEIYPRYVGHARGSGYAPDFDTRKYNITQPIGHIEQVAHTYGYQSSAYGVINEHGVSVAESTCGAMFGTCGRGSTVACEPGRKIGSALLSIDELSYIAMERSRTSREAVELMGSLASKYGFYGPPDSFEGSGESLIVGSPDEAWAFQILSDPSGTSAIWAAKRVPDMEMTVVANMFTIREVDPRDKDDFILSPNIFDAAKERGWWKEGQPFDFTRMYSGGEYAHKYYSGRRMWRGFRLAAPSLKLSPEYYDLRYKPAYPWSVKPDVPVTHHDVMAWHRDWYAGTQFDMTKGLQAGPFGTPDRFSTNSKVKGSWERSIALYRTNAVYVQHLQRDAPGRPKGLASVAWFGAGPAHYTPFVPIPAALTRTLGPLHFANPYKPEMSSLNWATRKILDVCQIRFDHMHPLVEAAQKKVEKDGDELIREMLQVNHANSSMLNKRFEQHAESVLKRWNKLASDLVFSFTDNTDMTSFHALSYPDSWLERVGYKDGPPDAPIEDQCPPKCPHQQAAVLV
jgi:dipeptidase